MLGVSSGGHLCLQKEFIAAERHVKQVKIHRRDREKRKKGGGNNGSRIDSILN